MTRLALEQVTDFGDFTRGKDLNDVLNQSSSNGTSKNCLSDVRVSPDGRHIHVILHRPRSGLLTFDKYQRPHLIQCQKYLDIGLTNRNVPIVDLVYLEHSGTDDGVAVLVIVFENGKVEFWKFLERKSGWHLQQTADLCNSPRAKVVSVCVTQGFIIWCEERPPSENSCAVSTTRNNFRYCICKRTYGVTEGGVTLGGVKVALHNNPHYTVISSGDDVYLLPNPNEISLTNISKFFLTWTPQNDSFKVSSACQGTFFRKNASNKESDFKRLVTDCVGVLSTINPPDLLGFSPTGSGGLLLLLATGWVCMLQKDGALRHIYKLPDNCLASCGTHNSLHLYRDVLALTVGRTLYLIDTGCGAELEKVAMKKEGLLFVNRLERHSPQLLSQAGLFVVMRREPDAKIKTSPAQIETVNPGAVIAEAVFEEACRFYQQRSLSSTQLTVEKLKKGGMFQAPIALAAILRDYLSGQKAGGSGGDPGGSSSGGQEKLLGSIDAELKSLVALEDIKTSMLRASEKDIDGFCQSLVQQEVARLLSSELDRDNLLYLNNILENFQSESWRALQNVLELQTGRPDGVLSAKASAEVWKTILSPVRSGGNFSHCNGQQKHTPANAATALPVFELICHSLFQFQPVWLPRFLELAQEQAGSSASSSSWSYGMKESGESLPLYKRALTVLREKGANQELEVELLLSSQRPNAVMQALRILMGRGQWERTTCVAERFCRQSPLLNKEIFTTLLCEVAQHRNLDPYLELLWALCPEDMTVTSILNIVLKNLPASSSSSSSSSPCSSTQGVGPFQHPKGGHLTIGLLKPLLAKVLQRETKPSQRYADILQSPTFPPPTPPRQAKGLPRALTEPILDPSASRKTTAPAPLVSTPANVV